MYNNNFENSDINHNVVEHLPPLKPFQNIFQKSIFNPNSTRFFKKNLNILPNLPQKSYLNPHNKIFPIIQPQNVSNLKNPRFMISKRVHLAPLQPLNDLQLNISENIPQELFTTRAIKPILFENEKVDVYKNEEELNQDFKHVDEQLF